NNGPFEGGTLVYFEGNYFANGIKVKFGDIYSSNVKYYNSGYITAVTPEASVAGAVDITLENPDGTKLVIPVGYQYAEKIVPTLKITS
ncbi:IPT/TIG domain-containing protein, partial [Mycobacterium kansasii]